MAARECCYNVYSDKLDHQRASESFWSKYFHVWICEDPFQESQRKTLVFLLSEFLQNLTLTCQALEKVSYIVGRSSDPSPSRGPVVPRLPCVRHPLIMFAFTFTFSSLVKTSPNNVCLHFHFSIGNLSQISLWIVWMNGNFHLYQMINAFLWIKNLQNESSGWCWGSCRDHLLSQRVAIFLRKRHWDSPCILCILYFFTFSAFF